MRQSLVALRNSIREQLIAVAEHDARIAGLVDYGSSSEGRADPLSDLDIALFIHDDNFAHFEQEWTSWVAQFGPLLLAYIGGVGHPWTVYDATPLPLRVDFAFHRASALDTVLEWPNAPTSTSAMVVYDATDGKLTSNAQRLVTQSLRPADLHLTFDSLCGDFWYYWLRTWTKVLRGELWAARYDFNFILLGNLVGLLRIEAHAVERWRSTSTATNIEQLLPAHRLVQLNQCVPERSETSLRRAFGEAAKLGYVVSTEIAAEHGWQWPKPLAERVLSIVMPSQFDPS